MSAPPNAPPRLALGVDYSLREGRESDVAFVLDTWRWSHMPVGARGMSRDDYMTELTPRILAAIARGVVTVAHDVQDEDALYGWSLWEGDVLHYVFVRKDLRGMGIARTLVGSAPREAVVYSHRSLAMLPRGVDAQGRPMPPRIVPPPTWRFNPWAFVPINKEK